MKNEVRSSQRIQRFFSQQSMRVGNQSEMSDRFFHEMSFE
jgi:hypothetical protein